MSTSQPLRLDKEKLKAKRIERRMTRAELARRTRITVDYLYNLETGRRTGNTREVTLGRLTDALECEAGEILAEPVAA
jgi:transcriptional regulator with XRE-family HTH domain